MARLVVVSNRVAAPRERGTRAGGLAVALREALAQRGGLWFGWSGDIAEGADHSPHLVHSGRITYATMDLEPKEHQAYYVAFANGVLWPMFHYRPGLVAFRREAFDGYIQVNATFARELFPLLRPDDVIWVHDYHFIPFACELRRLGVTNLIGFFLHIPFPPPELLVAMPGHRRLVSDLCAFDLVGLQTPDDVRALRRYIADEAGGRVDEDGSIEASGRRTRVGAFPIGIDTEPFARLAEGTAGGPEAMRLRESLAGRELVIGVDRLDYSKGLTNRLEAFRELLTRWPEHRSRVTFMQVAPISRGEVADYRTLRRELEGLAGRINGRFAEFDWVPVRYLNKSFSRQVLAGFYRSARVGMVTPIRDGMNLVAKEYVAAQDPEDPGVLVLSRFAGAARQMTDALIVNPFDIDDMAEALHTALAMPRDERVGHWSRLMAGLRSSTIVTWREEFLTELERAS